MRGKHGRKRERETYPYPACPSLQADSQQHLRLSLSEMALRVGKEDPRPASKEPWCSLWYFPMPDVILSIFSFPQLERQGAPLVEFDARQSVVLGEAVIQFSPLTEYSLRPGDKVLAPWEPDQQWYSPATILGLEARDSRRGKTRGSDLPTPRRELDW